MSAAMQRNYGALLGWPRDFPQRSRSIPTEKSVSYR